MSDCNLQACGDEYLGNMNSMRSNKSIWMDRWTTTSSKHLDVDQGEKGDQIAEPNNRKMLDINAAPCNISEYPNSWRYQGEDIAVATNVPHSTDGVEVRAEAKRVEITYETLAMNSTNLRGSRLESEPVPVFKFSEKIGRILARKRLAISIEHESVSQTDGISKHGNTIEPSNFNFLSEALGSAPTERTFQLRGFDSLPGSGSKCQLVKPFLSLDNVKLSGSKLFQDKVAGSSPNYLPYVFESREFQSSICRKEETDQLSSKIASLEHIKRDSPTRVEHDNQNHHDSSSVLVYDKQIDSCQLSSKNYDKSSYLWKNDEVVQLNDLSSNNFSHGKPRKRKDFTSTEHLPTQNCPVQLRRLEELYSGCHSSSDVLQPVHQIGALRAIVDSVEGVSKEPWISHTAGHQSIRDMSNGAPDLHYLSESASHKRFTLLSDFDRHKEHSEKLQPLGSPRNSERKIGVKDEWTASLASKNESSAETDTMDINVCQTWNSFPSLTSSASNKDTMVVENPAKSHSTILRATLGSRTDTELPDINQEPPSTLSLEKENVELSTSRTESLNVEHLHLDQAGNSSSTPQCPPLRPDTSNRWVKRLKPSLSGYHPHGTKNVKMEDPSSTAESDQPCNKMSDCTRTNLAATFNELFGEADTPGLDRTAASMPSLKEFVDINLSHPWIQRWCHNQASRPSTSTVPPMASGVDCSKTASNDHQINEFPSIAAMALMGKAMNGLQACKFQNKGSFIVWGKGRLPDRVGSDS